MQHGRQHALTSCMVIVAVSTSIGSAVGFMLGVVVVLWLLKPEKFNNPYDEDD